MRPDKTEVPALSGSLGHERTALMAVFGAIVAILAAITAAMSWLQVGRVRTYTEQLVTLHRAGGRTAVNIGNLLSLTANDLVLERLIIIGTFNRRIVVNRNNFVSEGQFVEQLIVDIPAGTTAVLPSLTGFAFAFGELLEVGEDRFQPRIVDHHLGLQYAEVIVDKIEAATATLRVFLALSDINGDDRWAGLLVVTGIFLGPETAGSPS